MFVEMLIEDIDNIANIPRKEMDDLTPELQDQYDNATSCWICNEEFTKDDGKKHYKVRIIVILRESLEELLTTYVILSIVDLNLRPYCFIILVGTMRIFFYKKSRCELRKY